MGDGSREMQGEMIAGAAGIALALHAATQASRRHAQVVNWQRREARIQHTRAVTGARHQHIHALQRQISAMQGLLAAN